MNGPETQSKQKLYCLLMVKDIHPGRTLVLCDPRGKLNYLDIHLTSDDAIFTVQMIVWNECCLFSDENE
jgi:hypothetical protein